ncbi:MAG: translocation/assembly module TamB domain-containing protein [Gammaproteobacteria bacterium]|nr:translocation/assembly module TamB domain-containing protein [Gammaproteobacteria bacterium]
MSRATLIRLVAYLPPVVASLALLVGAWFWYTEAGTRFIAEQLTSRTEGIGYEQLEGTLATRITAKRLVYETPDVTVGAKKVTLALDGYALLGGRLRLTRIDLSDVDVAWRNREPTSTPAPLRIPIPIDLGPADIRDLRISIDGGEPIVIDHFEGIAYLRERSLSVDIQSLAQEEIIVAGELSWQLAPPLEMSGRFRTQRLPAIGGRTLVAQGTFDVNADRLGLSADVTSPWPVNVRAHIGFDQRADIRLTAEPGSIRVLADFSLDGQPQVDARLEGTLYDRSFTGNLSAATSEKGFEGTLALAGGDNELSLALQDNRLYATGTFPRLERLSPELSGQADVELDATLDTGRFTARLDSKAAGFEQWSAQGIEASASGNFRERFDAAVEARGILNGDTFVGDARATYHGDLSGGDLELNWQREEIAASAGAAAAIDGGNVRLDVAKARVAIAEEAFTLAEPATVTFDDGNVTVGNSCWRPNTGTICLEQVKIAGAAIDARFNVHEVVYSGVDLTAADGRFRFNDGNLDVAVSATALEFGSATFTGVQLDATGPIENIKLTGAADVQSGDFLANLSLDGELAGPMLTFNSLKLQWANANIIAKGQYDIKAAHLVTSLGGVLMNHEIDGEANLSFAEPFDARAKINVAQQATLDLATDGARLEGLLEVRALGALVPGAYGSMSAGVNANFDTQAWSLWLHGANLDTSGLIVPSVTANARGTGLASADIALGLGQVELGGMYFGNGIITGTGTREAFAITTELNGDTWRLALASDISWQNGTITGRLRDGDLNAIERQWQLPEPVGFEFNDRVAQIESHCWQGTHSNLCIDDAYINEKTAALRASILEGPIALHGVHWAPDATVDGKFDLTVDVSSVAPFDAGNTTANIELDIPALSLQYFDADPMIWTLDGKLELSDGRLQSQLNGTSGPDNELRLSVHVPDVARSERILGRATLRSDTPGAITAFIPSLDSAQGIIDANATVDSLDGPLTATINVAVEEGASVAVPAAGIVVKDIALLARGDADRIDISLGGRSGDGTLQVNGTLDSPLSNNRSLKMNVVADQFNAIDRSDMALVASSDIDVVYESGGTTRARGDVTINGGKFTTGGLAAQTRSISPDVVVVARRPVSPPFGELDLALDVGIEDFTIDLYGLDGGLEGKVALTQRPNAPRRAVGNVSLQHGTFKRYGQTFEVERGRLIFSGPLTNPIVDVVSVREIEEVARTVRITLTLSGPADNISSSISASPTMSEAQALSYLILGRPLQSTTSGEEEALSQAALALGLRQAGNITEELRKSLGLEELTISSRGFDSTSVIAGKKLSDDLYVKYSYDIMGRVGGISLEYQISDRLSLQTQSGEEKSMRLIYSIE